MTQFISVLAFVLIACQFSLAQSDQEQTAIEVQKIARDFMTGAANTAGYFQSVVEMAGNLYYSGLQKATQQAQHDVETEVKIAGLIQEGKEVSGDASLIQQFIVESQGACPMPSFRLRKRQLPDSGIDFLQIAEKAIEPPPYTESVDIQDRYKIAMVLLSMGVALAALMSLGYILLKCTISSRTSSSILLALTSLAVGFLSSGLAADMNDQSYVAIVAGLVSGVGYLAIGGLWSG